MKSSPAVVTKRSEVSVKPRFQDLDVHVVVVRRGRPDSGQSEQLQILCLRTLGSDDMSSRKQIKKVSVTQCNSSECPKYQHSLLLPVKLSPARDSVVLDLLRQMFSGGQM
jgi:hypothetical protein